MAEYEIRFRAEARAFFASRRVDARIKRIVLVKIRILARSPDLGKPLAGELTGYRRLAVSYYRIIYHVDGARLVVDIIQIGLRRDVYGN